MTHHGKFERYKRLVQTLYFEKITKCILVLSHMSSCSYNIILFLSIRSRTKIFTMCCISIHPWRTFVERGKEMELICQFNVITTAKHVVLFEMHLWSPPFYRLVIWVTHFFNLYIIMFCANVLVAITNASQHAQHIKSWSRHATAKLHSTVVSCQESDILLSESNEEWFELTERL